MKLQSPFVQLPITFDAAALAAEVEALGDTWHAREDGAPGNSALSLVTANGDPESAALAGPMRPTPWLARCPYTMQVLDALGATWGRARLMRLDGGAQVPAHVDTDYYWRERMRVHVPIVTSPAVRFQCGQAEVNMAAGECWIFDTWRPHRVLNTSAVLRIHLVADTVGGARLWDLVTAGRPHGARVERWAPMHVPYDPSAPVPRLDFETVNLSPVMGPWELRSHIGFVLSEAVPHPALPGVRDALGVFVRRWHALWSAHGEDRAGWPRYRQLLDGTRAELARLRVNEIGLRNEVQLIRALASYIFDVALGDRPDAGAFRNDPHDVARLRAAAKPEAGTRTPPARAGLRDPVFADPVFIVSAPRSGSTLLFETLSAAPGLYTIGNESHQLVEAIPALNPVQRGHDSNRLTAADATPEVVALLRERFHAALRDRDGRRPAPGAGVRMLEKTPKNALRIPFLRAVFPEAKFIYLHRDPRQVLGSMIDGWQHGGFRMYDLPGWTGLPWSFLLVPGWRELVGKPLDEVVAAQWERTSQCLLDDLAELEGGQWIASDYARLLADPQAEVARLCAWAGWSWDRPLGSELPLSRSTTSRPDPGKWRRHADLIEPRLPALEPTEARIAKVLAG